MITAALAAITSRKWLVELILAAVVALAIWWGCHHLIEVGVQRQKDADAAASAIVQRDADIKTAKAEERARLAEIARDVEHKDSLDYRDQHPLVGRVRVCTASNSGVSEAARAQPGDAATAAAADLGEQVYSPDSGRAYDRGELSDAFAALFDDTSAQVREFQGRQ